MLTHPLQVSSRCTDVHTQTQTHPLWLQQARGRGAYWRNAGFVFSFGTPTTATQHCSHMIHKTISHNECRLFDLLHKYVHSCDAEYVAYFQCCQKWGTMFNTWTGYSPSKKPTEVHCLQAKRSCRIFSKYSTCFPTTWVPEQPLFNTIKTQFSIRSARWHEMLPNKTNLLGNTRSFIRSLGVCVVAQVRTIGLNQATWLWLAGHMCDGDNIQSSYSNFPKKKSKKSTFWRKKKHFLKKKSTFCKAFYHIFWFEIKSCFSDYSLIMAKM